MWLRWWVHCGLKDCKVVFEVGPTSNSQLRRRVIERLTQPDATFGCKITGRQTDKWTRLRRETVAKWTPDEEPDSEQLLLDFEKKIEKFAKELAGVPDALRSIFEEWKKSRGSQ